MFFRYTWPMEIPAAEKLARLARLKLSAEELANLASSIEPILGYVGQISEVSVEAVPRHELVKNVLREDVVQNETGAYTEALLNSAPKQKDGFVQVQKILNNE